MSDDYRTVWVSDVHLGTRASRAAELIDFLDRVPCRKLYLVGDIVDLERIKVRPSFSALHKDVLTRFVELAAQADVILIPGNHDHEFREFAGQSIMGIPVMLEAEHVTPLGHRLLVTHGDVLDGRIRKGTNLEKFGSAAYNMLMDVDVAINQMRRALGRDYLSVSALLKAKLSRANEYIRRFENVAVEYAAERGFDGVVCGHIHRPAAELTKHGIYANDGDWVEHATALAERHDGTLEILRYAAGEIVVEQTLQIPARPLAAA